MLTAAIPVTDALLGQVAKKAMQKVAQKLAQQAIKHTVGLPDGVTWTQEPIRVGRDYVGQRERERIRASEKTKTAEKVGVNGAVIAGEGEETKSECGNSNKNKGDCAEKLVNEKYEKYEKFDTKRLENKSGHGIDNILSKDGKTVVIETKANTSQLNKWQKQGGKKYLKRQIGAMEDGLNGDGGRWKKFEGDADLEDALDELEELLDNNKIEYKICRVKLKDDPTGCYGKDGNGKCEADGEVDCEKSWDAPK
ncbi:hypothetical protein MNB_SM-4-290 [hydrothermal vent metagenome]|uniref:Uncharacterized protein n=1 Tax=hydrothermal vent metagenome TaxID=652676 RepID=A0A1W1BV06_9ZZZZ